MASPVPRGLESVSAPRVVDGHADRGPQTKRGRLCSAHGALAAALPMPLFGNLLILAFAFALPIFPVT